MQPVGIGGPRQTAVASRWRRARSGAFIVVFVAVVMATVVGFLVARDRAVDETERTAQLTADRAATSLETRLRQLASELIGAGTIAGPEGSLDLDAFRSFADDLLAAEEVSGLTLVGFDPGNQQTPYPVLAVVPEVPGRTSVGMDFGAAPARAAALRASAQTEEPSISGVVDLAATGEPGVKIVRPVVDRTGGTPNLRGFVATGVRVEHLEDVAGAALEPGMRLAVLDGDELLLGTEFEPRVDTATAAVVVAGESWSLVVGPVGTSDLTLAWWIGGAGLAAIAAMVALAWMTSRHRRHLARADALLARSEERGRAVQEVAGRLARALSGGDIVTALVDHLPAAVGARSALIGTVDDAGQLEVLGPDVAAGAPAARFLGDDLAGSVVGEVLQRGEPAWLSSPLAWRGDGVTGAFAGDGQALALLPLVADDVVGVLAVSYPRIRIFAEDEQAFLETIGLLASRALARGRRYDNEHEVALAFQHAALPSDLPSVDGLTIAARYRPAKRQATIGGDWYDVLALDDRRVVLVVGDVVGHGLVAAAAMGRLRTAFQAIASLSADPGAMLQALSTQVESIPDSFCTTVVCAVVDLEAGTMTWCRAGHPPPLVLGRRGVRLFDESCLPPLGVAPEMDPPVHTHALDEDDLVVLYTDGMIERRGESIDRGFERLGIVADNLADLDPDEFSDALVEALVPVEDQTDDLAVLVVRFDRRPPHAEIELRPAVSTGEAL